MNQVIISEFIDYLRNASRSLNNKRCYSVYVIQDYEIEVQSYEDEIDLSILIIEKTTGNYKQYIGIRSSAVINILEDFKDGKKLEEMR